MDMVALAVYKVPAGLFQKAMKNKRKKRLQQKKSNKKKNETGLLDRNSSIGSGPGPDTFIVGPTLEEHLAKEESPEVVNLEDEMWARFSVTGFWRSDSQRQFQHEPELQTGEKDR